MFNFINLFIGMFMFICGIMVYTMKYKHLLCTLLSLEFIVLSLFYLIMIILMKFEYELYFMMIFMVFSVCEGALGLSILVSMIRTHGNDYFQSFTVLL